MLSEENLSKLTVNEIVSILSDKLTNLERLRKNNSDRKVIELAGIELDLIEHTIGERTIKNKTWPFLVNNTLLSSMNAELAKKISDMEMLIAVEEENYKVALQKKVNFDTLKSMRENIRKMKGDLQILLDQQSVIDTGDLPPTE